MKLRSAVLGCVFLSATTSAASGWVNPSERYTDAYKSYLDAKCPIEKNEIKHFVYLARDRERLRGHVLLESERFSGAQIMYAWNQLEPSKDIYDFSIIEDDIDYLKARNKKLFIQLQDATFDPKYRAAPGYLLSEEYDGGEVLQRGENGDDGWTAKRWNKAVQQRFGALLRALGERFDGKVEGINLQETALGVSSEIDRSFTPDKYVEGLKNNMAALKRAFARSATMQYANFVPGEWLPLEDKGYLKSIYAYGEEIGVGLGAPDLMVRRKGQLNHAIAMMHENEYTAPLGIAIQDGNYIGQTNSAQVVERRPNLVPLLHEFAADFLRVDYMFWVDQAPYFEEDVLPCFESTR
jgi:hypothetical protein